MMFCPKPLNFAGKSIPNQVNTELKIVVNRAKGLKERIMLPSAEKLPLNKLLRFSHNPTSQLLMPPHTDDQIPEIPFQRSLTN